MADTDANSRALAQLQDDIYREKVRRARSLTPEQRLDEAFELTNMVFARMHEGAMWQLGTSVPDDGWREVNRRLEKLACVHDAGRYVLEKPASSGAK